MPVQILREDQTKTKNGRDGKHPSTKIDRQALIEGLNHDLAGEYQAIVMYIHYSAKLTGPYRRELRSLFQAEIADAAAGKDSLSCRRFSCDRTAAENPGPASAVPI